MSKEMDRSDPDRLLCPVRALKFYLGRTGSIELVGNGGFYLLGEMRLGTFLLILYPRGYGRLFHYVMR